MISTLTADLGLWIVSTPSLAALSLVLVSAAGVSLLVFLLVRADEGRAPELALPAPLKREFLQLQDARRRVSASLRGASPELRGALEPLIARPLVLYEERVASLLQAGRLLPLEASEVERTLESRDQVLADLGRESDPRARELLESSLEDLERTRRVQVGLMRGLRLARLELNRLRTLLDSLPARIQELVAQRALHSQGRLAADIGVELEQAIQSTSQVLEEVFHGSTADPSC